MRIVVASYNTHAGIGLDRRFAPERIAQVVAELGADIVALQELQSRAGGDMLEHLRAASGFHAVAGTTLARDGFSFGNGLLSRYPVMSSSPIALGVAGREPRGAIDVLLDCGGTPLRVVATHLGLRARERRGQIARLLHLLRARPAQNTLLLGDLNEWLLPRRRLRWLHEHFGESPARATFPSLLPLFALDRVWIAPAAALCSVRAHSSRQARRASDHLPLVATIELDASRAVQVA